MVVKGISDYCSESSWRFLSSIVKAPMEREEMRWERLQVQQLEELEEGFGGPGKRWGHTCNSVRAGSFLYVFGGFGGDNCQTNQVHVFDTAKKTWTQPKIKDLPPDPRDSHTCTTVGDNLYIFGGTDGLNLLGDLHILNTVSHTWISPSVRGDGPEAREGHSSALVGTQLFIFGGCGRSLATKEEVCYNDLYVLDTETLVWKKHVVTSGNPPCARDSHTCSSWNYKMIVIGGEDENNNYFSDVHILDAETLVWKELITTGPKFPPRAGHSTVALGKHLFVFGGFSDAENLYNDVYMLDVDNAIWTKVATTGHVPSARISASGDCLDPAEFGVLMFFGGCSKALEALGDAYYLHTGVSGVQDDEKWPKMCSLRKQLKLKRQEQVPVNLEADQSQFRQGKKTIQAKVTETFSNGYGIEAVIDGKPLRGILFFDKPVLPQIINLDNTRKRSSAEVGVVVSNDDCDSKPKVSRTTSEEDAVDLKQINNVHVKEPTTNETISEEAANIPDSSVAPSLNLNDDARADVPAAGEDPKETDKMAKDSNTLPAVEDVRTQVSAEVQTDPRKSARGVNMPPNCAHM